MHMLTISKGCFPTVLRLRVNRFQLLVDGFVEHGPSSQGPSGRQTCQTNIVPGLSTMELV